MTRVQALEEEIEKLSPAELAELQEWLAEREADAWDREIERDAASGKLDKLFEKSLADHRAGKSREILRHFTSPDFWERFSRLPAEIQRGGP